VKTLEEKVTNGNPFKHMHGSDLGLGWVESDETAMREPIIVDKPDGLGMKMPSNALTVRDIVELVGGDTMLEVIGVSSVSFTVCLQLAQSGKMSRHRPRLTVGLYKSGRNTWSLNPKREKKY
jgi:hypothetical protein